jgi:hypothetical protein
MFRDSTHKRQRRRERRQHQVLSRLQVKSDPDRNLSEAVEFHRVD